MSGELSGPMEFSLLFKWEADCHFEHLPGDSLSLTSLWKGFGISGTLSLFLPTVKGHLSVLSAWSLLPPRTLAPVAFLLCVCLPFLDASGPVDLSPDVQEC